MLKIIDDYWPTSIKWYWPIAFVGFRTYGDVREYGFRFQPTTECTYYTYEWGWGFSCVILGAGFEAVFLPFQKEEQNAHEDKEE